MPAVNFRVRWPDDSQSECYSPSTIIRDYVKAGQSLTIAEFAERSRSGLCAASERGRQRYGYACSSAMDQLAQIERHCRKFKSDAIVEIVAMR